MFNDLKEELWNNALKFYDELCIQNNLCALDARLSLINISIVKKLNAQEFGNFVYGEFYYWKYHNTASAMNIEKYKANHPMSDEELGKIKLALEDESKSDRELLEIACSIRGLGYPGATALLSLFYPERFGIVDSFVIRFLHSKEQFKQDEKISNIDDRRISLNDVIAIIDLYQKTAKKLNEKFNSVSWTARAVEKAVWATAHNS